MPYYFGADLPGWEEYLDEAESEGIDLPPLTSFQYVEPWQTKTSVVSFPATPGTEPTIPPNPEYPAKFATPANQSFLSRLFGQPPAPAPAPAQPTPEDWQNWRTKFFEVEKARSAHALWKVSKAADRFRAAGVRRVFGGYDGGGDESFTHFRSVEMNDGRRLDYNGLEQNWLDCEALIFDAAAAIMGQFDAGEFTLRGALTVDFDACTITDEKDAAIVFEDIETDAG